MKNFPEIENLKAYFKNHKIEIEKTSMDNLTDDFVSVELSIDDSTWELLVEDEYNDFVESNPLMNLYLTLVSLEVYKESEDFLVWCHQYGIDASDTKWLEYYKSLESKFFEIENKLGEINSYITSFDYQLRTRVITELVKGL